MTSTPSPREAVPPPAAVRDRIIAGVIDLVSGGVLWAGLVLLLTAVLSKDLLVWGAATVVIAAPRELVLARTGWSPGGRLMGVRLVDASTGGPPMTRLFVHADLLFFAMISTACLGAIAFMRSSVADPNGQGWHDRMSGMMAVTTRSRSDQRPEHQGHQTPRRQSPRRQVPRRQVLSHQGPQHAAPRTTGRDRVFPENTFFLAPNDSTASDIGNTVDTTSMVAPPPSADRAIIDSVPWSSVPTHLDTPTGDEAPLASAAAESLAVTTETIRSVPGGVSSPSPHETVVTSPLTASASSPHPPSTEEPVTVSPSYEPTPSVPRTRGRRASSHSSASSPELISTDSVPVAPPVISASSPAAARGRHRHTEDPRASRLMPLTGGTPIVLDSTTVVGRDPDNISEYRDATCVALGDANRSISKTHAALAPVPGGLWITDLHSTNGTRVEEEDGSVTTAKPDEPVPVPTGATIVLGSAAFRVED